MREMILKYLDGDLFAEDMLIDEIMELHNYSIDKFEAKILLEKKYGKANSF